MIESVVPSKILIDCPVSVVIVNSCAVLPYYRNGKILALIGVDFVRPLSKEAKEKYNNESFIEINLFKKRY